jgi:hypothetical protein
MTAVELVLNQNFILSFVGTFAEMFVYVYKKKHFGT